MKAVIKQVIKAVKLRYPNDVFLSANCVTQEITFTDKTGKVRTEKANAGDIEHLPLLGELYGFKKVHVIDMDFKTGNFTIKGIDENDKDKTEKV